jgi:hypothetical protein
VLERDIGIVTIDIVTVRGGPCLESFRAFG